MLGVSNFLLDVLDTCVKSGGVKNFKFSAIVGLHLRAEISFKSLATSI